MSSRGGPSRRRGDHDASSAGARRRAVTIVRPQTRAFAYPETPQLLAVIVGYALLPLSDVLFFDGTLQPEALEERGGGDPLERFVRDIDLLAPSCPPDLVSAV